MPGNREPNRGPEQGYGQGGYNSLNRGNQVSFNPYHKSNSPYPIISMGGQYQFTMTLSSLSSDNQTSIFTFIFTLQIIRVGGQDLGPGLRAQYPPQPGDGGCVVRSVSVFSLRKIKRDTQYTTTYMPPQPY